MSAQPTLPLHATPKLHIYDPSGQPIHQPEVPKITIDMEKEKNKEESPPMFKCGDRLCIFTGDDYYHLPKEMDISHWEGDLGDLYNFKQFPYGDWPAKIPAEYLDIPEPGQVDVEMSDNGDFEPMELFKHYHELSPNPKEKTFLETIADADEEDEDMMEYLETQVSTTQTALCDSDLESDSPHISASSTSSTGTLSFTASSESDSLIAHSESASHPTHIRSNASATSMSMIPDNNEKRRSSRSRALSQSHSDIPSSSQIEAALSQALDSESRGSAGDVSWSSSSISPTAGAHLSHTDSNVTNQSGTSVHSVSTVDEKIDGSTHSTQTEAQASLSSLSPCTKRSKSSTTQVNSIKPRSASSQESLSSSYSSHHSTSTDGPRVVTPELHPSRLDVTIDDSDDQSSTPPLSPDNDISMMADTTFGTIKSDEDVFYNGDLVSDSAMDFSMAKTDSEEEEDSDDEDRPLIPRLLFDQMARLASIKQKSPKHQTQARQPIKATGQASDFFSPAVEVKLPRTPERSRRCDQSRQRGTTAPAPLLSAFKMAPGYEPPKHRQRPFFPNQTSDTRRAGTEEPSPSTIFPERHTFQNHASPDATPSRPLFLLANAAVDAADGPGDGDDTWPRSGTVMDLGDQSQEVANASLASVGIANDNAKLQVHRSSLTSAPSPSEPIWQKGHVVKASKASTSASKGRRGFVPPAPKGQCPAAPENIRAVLPLAPAGTATPAAKQTSNLKRSRETPPGRQPLVPAQSTDSIATYVESPRVKQKSRVQLSSIPKIWSPPVGCVKTIQRNNSAGLKPNRRFGYTPSKVLKEDTVKLRQVRDERSPSPSPEPETLDSSVPMEVDLPNESQETVSSADSGLMGRPIVRSPSPPLITAPGRGRGRGRGGGRPRGRGRGRGMTRASTSTGRQTSAKPDIVNVGAKRKPGNEDVSEVPAKKVKATRGRSKSVSGPSRKAYSPVKEASPVQEIAPTEVAPPIENVPSVESVAPLEPVIPMEDVLPIETVAPVEEASPVEDPIVDTPESIPESEPKIASVPLTAQSRYSASTSTRSSRLPPPTPEAEMESEAEVGGAESPDPIALVPGDDLEVKQEALDDHHAKVKPGKGKGRGGGHPRQYSTEELVIILNTLGPDKRLWDRSSKSKLEEICENLSKAGYMERTPAAMRFKVKELFHDER